MADDGLVSREWLNWFNQIVQKIEQPRDIYTESIVDGKPLTKTDDTNVTLTLGGTPATALLKPVSLTLGWTGTLAPARGGTGISSYAVGDLLYASAATTLSKLSDVAVGSYLRSGGVTTAPLWSTLTLPNAATTGDVLIATGSNAIGRLADVAVGSYLRSGGVTTAPLWSTVTLPNTDATGDLWYASGANTLAARAIGSTNDVLTVSGGVPTWSAAASVATNVTITNDNTTNATMFPVWVTASSGNLPPKVSSTQLTLNPSTGVLGTVAMTASALAALTTAAESWIGPSTTTGIYFKSGFVGFGAVPPTGPATNVHIISQSGAVQLRLTESTLAQNVSLSISTAQVGWVAAGNIPIVFGTSGLAGVVIRSGGSNTQMEVRGQSAMSGAYFDITSSGGSTGDILRMTATALLGIGQRVPTAAVHIKAGTATASTAPLKFTSGTLLTSAEAGAVEFLTDDFYGTITTGAARKGIVLNDGTALTSGRVPFATTNGRLTDDSDLTFATDTLTATKLSAPTSVATGTLAQTGKTITYNNITTAGWGVPAIQAEARLTAQTAAVASVAAYTLGAADGSVLVSANVNVTTSTLHSFSVQVAYTDETNTAQTLTMPMSQLAGTLVTLITNTTGAGPYEGVPLHLRCKASTAVTVKTTGTFTTVTYNVEGAIQQIA